ncbi:MAG TPA: SDR family oxidoreductase [Thermoanaerobaculia bacterium]
MGTWVVTGANRGIGLAFARALSKRGETVVGTARQPAGANELRAAGARVEKLDVSKDSSVADFVRRLEGVPVDVLVHNAAVGEEGSRIEELEPDAVLRALDVNAVGPERVTRALLPNLFAGRLRKVVAITSGLGSLSQNTDGGWYAYRMSKVALNMFVRTLAEELAKERFTCAVLSPGWVRTAMGGPNAPLTPDESVAEMLKVIDGFRPSDAGRFLDRHGRDVPW